MGISWHMARCYTLTDRSARVPDPEQRLAILREALHEAAKLEEPNRAATASSVPLKALLDNEMLDVLKEELVRVLRVLDVETHPVQRQDALVWLMRQLICGPEPVVETIVGRFREACLAGKGWKTDYNLRWAAEMLKERFHAQALDLALLIWRPRIRRLALRSIGEDEKTPSIIERRRQSGVVCPLCGMDGAFTQRGGKETCPDCGWIDDPDQFRDPDRSAGENETSLNRSRARRALARVTGASE